MFMGSAAFIIFYVFLILDFIMEVAAGKSVKTEFALVWVSFILYILSPGFILSVISFIFELLSGEMLSNDPSDRFTHPWRYPLNPKPKEEAKEDDSTDADDSADTDEATQELLRTRLNLFAL